jgi:hypothetical protein
MTSKTTKKLTRGETKRSMRKRTCQKMGEIAKNSNGSRAGEFQKRSRLEDESRGRFPERNGRTRRIIRKKHQSRCEYSPTERISNSMHEKRSELLLPKRIGPDFGTDGDENK